MINIFNYHRCLSKIFSWQVRTLYHAEWIKFKACILYVIKNIFLDYVQKFLNPIHGTVEMYIPGPVCRKGSVNWIC